MSIKQSIIDDNINVTTKLNLQLNESQGNIVANSGDQSQQGANNFEDGIITGDVDRITRPGGDDAIGFNSSDDRIRVSDHAALDLGNESFALNMQFKPDSGSMESDAEYTLMSTRENGGTGFSLEKISGKESLTLTLQDSRGKVHTFDIDPAVIQIQEDVKEVEGVKWNNINVNVERNGRQLNVNVQVRNYTVINDNVINDNGIQEQDFSSRINPYAVLSDSNSDLIIGANSNNHGFAMDSVKILGGNLSDIEIESLYRVETNQDGLVPNSQSIQASWDFDAMDPNLTHVADSNGRSDLNIINPNNVDISTQGVFDNGLVLDGSQTLTASNNQNLNFGTQDMSISAWINTQDNDGVILEKIQTNPNGTEQGFSLSIDNDQITFKLAGVDQSGNQSNVQFKLSEQQSAPLLDGEQHSLVVTVQRDASSPDVIEQVVFYQNADVITSSPEVVDLVTPGNSQSQMMSPVSIGNIDSSADLVMGSNLSGSLETVQLFNTTLSQYSINELFDPSSIILGSEGNDIAQGVFRGTEGNNIMVAGLGNDIVDGVSGSNTLIGIDPNALNPGVNEIDTLIGGNQAGSQDTFVLGDAYKSFYVGNDNLDKAIIQNLNVNQDIIQLSGDISDYDIQSNGIDSSITLSSSSDLIAEVQGVDLTIAAIQSVVLDFA